eukprot:1758323-Rhodomonas_salina.1
MQLRDRHLPPHPYLSTSTVYDLGTACRLPPHATSVPHIASYRHTLSPYRAPPPPAPRLPAYRGEHGVGLGRRG